MDCGFAFLGWFVRIACACILRLLDRMIVVLILSVCLWLWCLLLVFAVCCGLRCGMFVVLS